MCGCVYVHLYVMCFALFLLFFIVSFIIYIYIYLFLFVLSVHNPSGHFMALGSTQPLTEMSTRSISWGVKAVGA